MQNHCKHTNQPHNNQGMNSISSLQEYRMNPGKSAVSEERVRGTSKNELEFCLSNLRVAFWSETVITSPDLNKKHCFFV